MTERPKYITKEIHAQSAAWDLLKVTRIPEVLEKNDEPGYEVCGVAPSGTRLYAIYRRVDS